MNAQKRMERTFLMFVVAAVFFFGVVAAVFFFGGFGLFLGVGSDLAIPESERLIMGLIKFVGLVVGFLVLAVGLLVINGYRHLLEVMTAANTTKEDEGK